MYNIIFPSPTPSSDHFHNPLLCPLTPSCAHSRDLPISPDQAPLWCWARGLVVRRDPVYTSEEVPHPGIERPRGEGEWDKEVAFTLTV